MGRGTVNDAVWICYLCLQLAEKRKGLVDEMAIEKQNSDTEHREQLERQQEEHKVS